MSTLTIRNLNEDVKSQLRINAAKHGWAMEEEVRRILTHAVHPPFFKKGLGSAIHARFNGLEQAYGALELPQRTLPRAAPQF